MIKLLYKFVFTVIIFVASGSPAFASSCFTETYGVSLRSMSMGRAFTAIADDFSAVYYNPAGLAQTTKTSMSIDLIQSIHDISVTYLESGQPMKMYDVHGEVKNDPVHSSDGGNLDILFPVLGMSVNINRLLSRYFNIPINIQAGLLAGLPGRFNSLFTTNTTAPDMPNLIAFGDQIEHFMATMGLGLEVKKDLLYLGWSTTIGIEMGGPHPLYCQNVWLGFDEESRNVITQAEAPATTKMGHQVGGLLTLFDKRLKIGVAYREPLDVVTVDFTPIRVYLTTRGIPQDGLKVMEDVAIGYLPEQLSLGLAYSFEPFTVSLDYKYLKWSDYEYTKTIYYLYVVNETGIAKTDQIPEPGSPDFNDVGHIGLGLEYKHSNKLLFTAGYEYRPTMVPDQSYRLSNYLDMDKNIFSFGTSYHAWKYMKIGLLLQYMMLDDYTVYKTGNEIGYTWGWDVDDRQQSYKVEGDAFVVGLSFEFTL